MGYVNSIVNEKNMFSKLQISPWLVLKDENIVKDFIKPYQKHEAAIMAIMKIIE
jgi:hypothetical protein